MDVSALRVGVGKPAGCEATVMRQVQANRVGSTASVEIERVPGVQGLRRNW